MKVNIKNWRTKNFILFNLDVLFPQELEKLLNVPTTGEQAFNIRKRNQKALDALDRAKQSGKRVIDALLYGCPHCDWNCENCAWEHYPRLGYSRTSHYCLGAIFKGVHADMVAHIIGLASSFIRINYNPLVDSGKSFREALSFLEGHIEWANAVIELGGITDKDLYTVKEAKQ